jgi:hypothetical protein
MAAVIAEQELLQSCRVLFGTDKSISRDFLEYIQFSGVKSAYREKALETHPDILGRTNGENTHQNADLFLIVQEAYENLTGYLEARERGFRFHVPLEPVCPDQFRSTAAPKAWSQPHTQRARSPRAGDKTETSGRFGTNSGSDRYNQAYSRRCNDSSQNPGKQIPSRRLLFGQYLYFCGVANWQTIIAAIVWQRQERPRIGELARNCGWLSSQDILNVLKHRNHSGSFGRSAVDMGLLTKSQLQILLFQQKRLQKKFGQYFIQNKLLTLFELQRLIDHFCSHNTAITLASERLERNSI